MDWNIADDKVQLGMAAAADGGELGRRALADRGYPAGLEENVDLEIKDDLIPKNHGRFTLKVAGGRARAARGGSGAVRLDVRRLASLYSGYLNPDEHTGIEGPKSELEKLRRIFAGPTPWMVETF